MNRDEGIGWNHISPESGCVRCEVNIYNKREEHKRRDEDDEENSQCQRRQNMHSDGMLVQGEVAVQEGTTAPSREVGSDNGLRGIEI